MRRRIRWALRCLRCEPIEPVVLERRCAGDGVLDLVQTTGAVVGIDRGPAVGMDRLMESVQAVVRVVGDLSAPIDELNRIPGEVVHIALGICQWIRTSTCLLYT